MFSANIVSSKIRGSFKPNKIGKKNVEKYYKFFDVSFLSVEGHNAEALNLTIYLCQTMILCILWR